MHAGTRVAALPVTTDVFGLVLTVLVPAMYVDWVRYRTHLTADARAHLATVRAALLATGRADAAWQALPPATRQHLVAVAQDCAQGFVRCTDSTERHNGWSRRRFNQIHTLRPDGLATQRVLHNFLIQRADGTTAARRVFGADHPDGVEHRVACMPLPARPRRRTKHPRTLIERLDL